MGKKSFTYGGVYMGNYGLYIDTAQFRFPLMPRPRDRVVEVPGRDGKIYLGSDLGEREFAIPVILTVPSLDDYWPTLRSIAAIFNKGLQQIVFDTEPDKYITAKYNGIVSIEQIVRRGKFELPMVAYDPYFYPVSEAPMTVTITQNNQVIVITKDENSVDEYPKIRITNNGATPVTGISLAKL